MNDPKHAAAHHDGKVPAPTHLHGGRHLSACIEARAVRQRLVAVIHSDDGDRYIYDDDPED